MTTAVPDARAAAARRAWMPRQHGAWAMLLLPILLGVAVSRPSPWQAALAGAAVAGYLASATFQAWSRARRSTVYRRPLLAYSAAFAVLAGLMALAFPALLLVLAVAAPAGLVVVGGAKPGTPRDLAASLAQVALALTLVPSAAWVSGTFEPGAVAAATAIAAGYLVGTVLVVRSVIRERANPRFAAASVGFHLALVALAAAWLPVAYAVVGSLLAVRSAAFPYVRGRRAGGPRPLRPVHLGIAEMVATALIVLVAFLLPPSGVIPG